MKRVIASSFRSNSNIRVLPSTRKKIVGSLSGIGIVTNLETSVHVGSYDWYKITEGWIREDVVQFADIRPKEFNVPLVSQNSEEAMLSRNDCGAACMAMMIEHYHTGMVRPTVDKLFLNAGGRGNSFLTFNQLIQTLKKYNIVLTHKIPTSAVTLMKLDRPAIVLVDHKLVNNNIGSSFGHFVVYNGYDEDLNIIYNDPNIGGIKKMYFQDFMRAMSSRKTGNMPFQSIF